MPLQPGDSEMRSVHRHDYGFWVLSLLLGLLPLAPRLVRPGQLDDGTELILVYGGLFLGGAFLGLMRPAGSWRWAVGVIPVLLVADLSLAAYEQVDEPLWFQEFLTFAANNPVRYLTPAAVALAGSLLGSFLSREGE